MASASSRTVACSRHRRDDLVNHFARRCRRNMPAENLPTARIGDELDKALGLGLHQRLPERSHLDQRKAHFPAGRVPCFSVRPTPAMGGSVKVTRGTTR